jgi:hypothetical protein
VPRARTLLAFAVLTVLVTAVGGVAQARPRVCEIEEIAEAPADEPPPPSSERRQCRPGVHDDAGCWPEDQAPGPGPRVRLTLEGVVLLVGSSALPGPDRARLSAPHESAVALADGHVRRVERPPRSSSLA